MANRDTAWVTLATNDTYCLGALVLGYSLRRVHTKHSLAVIITPSVTSQMRDALSKVYDSIHCVDVLDSKDAANLALLKRPDLGVTFTKIHCWNLTQYKKAVFLDADTLVIDNSDELFEREEFSAAPDPGWPDCFNSGVFVFTPSTETFKHLIQFAAVNGSFDGGDQGLLNMYFSDWSSKDIKKRLSFLYNMCSTTTYTYLPALKYYGGKTKIVHFIGANKPWLQGSSSITLSTFVQAWWDIFHSHVASTLTKEMTGLAGAIGSKEKTVIEEQWRKQNWEQGIIDFTGVDCFDNIWKKIIATVNKPPPPITKSKPPMLISLEQITGQGASKPQSPDKNITDLKLQDLSSVKPSAEISAVIASSIPEAKLKGMEGLISLAESSKPESKPSSQSVLSSAVEILKPSGVPSSPGSPLPQQTVVSDSSKIPKPSPTVTKPSEVISQGNSKLPAPTAAPSADKTVPSMDKVSSPSEISMTSGSPQTTDSKKLNETKQVSPPLQASSNTVPPSIPPKPVLSSKTAGDSKSTSQQASAKPQSTEGMKVTVPQQLKSASPGIQSTPTDKSTPISDPQPGVNSELSAQLPSSPLQSPQMVKQTLAGQPHQREQLKSKVDSSFQVPVPEVLKEPAHDNKAALPTKKGDSEKAPETTKSALADDHSHKEEPVTVGKQQGKPKTPSPPKNDKQKKEQKGQQTETKQPEQKKQDKKKGGNEIKKDNESPKTPSPPLPSAKGPEKPTATTPLTDNEKPQVSRLEASQPQANPPQANQPPVGLPPASQQQASQPQAIQPQPSLPQATKPQVTQPPASQPQPSQPQATKPQAPQPQAGKQPQATQPQATQPQATQPQATQPQATQPQATQPQATQPQATQPQAPQPQASKPQLNQQNKSQKAQGGKQTAPHPPGNGKQQKKGQALPPLKQQDGPAINQLPTAPAAPSSPASVVSPPTLPTSSPATPPMAVSRSLPTAPVSPSASPSHVAPVPPQGTAPSSTTPVASTKTPVAQTVSSESPKAAEVAMIPAVTPSTVSPAVTIPPIAPSSFTPPASPVISEMPKQEDKTPTVPSREIGQPQVPGTPTVTEPTPPSTPQEQSKPSEDATSEKVVEKEIPQTSPASSGPASSPPTGNHPVPPKRNKGKGGNHHHGGKSHGKGKGKK